MPDRDNYAVSGNSSDEVAPGTDDICRDFLRNVCRRGKRCRFRHPDTSEVSDMGVKKNELFFCHDFQNKECTRPNCKFIHATKEEEEYCRQTGGLPPTLRSVAATGLGRSTADLGKGEVPLCRDYLKEDCQRGAKCKFRHLKRDYEYEPRAIDRLPRDQALSTINSVRRYERYMVNDSHYDEDRFDEHDLVLKRRRIEDARYDTYDYSISTTRTVDYCILEQENIMLRRRVEELKKQVSNLLATNDFLLEQNAQFRTQAKIFSLTSTPAATEQSLASTVGTVTNYNHGIAQNYNHGIAQTHTTLSSQALQPRQVNQQDLVAAAGAAASTNAALPAAAHLTPDITPLSAALAQTIAQRMAPPVSMAQVAVSVASVAVSMAQAIPGMTMTHASSPMVTYPIASQSMRITPM
ncbi:zinc finger CCCH domain-containing protein 10-like isoform X2 [Protopterus annectens]|uniref:zinc finger CCCH domain-containing protein 10-like isoform X2 n=1 Tax=Protopterus annectens TaxID=7888 RepID=UPI001CFC3D87|nr:zinc finger CCCH domain-containing protein 10-like isoform X2 [Protopterus annectens]